MAGGRGPKSKGDSYERELADHMNTKIPGLSASRMPLSGGGASHGLAPSADLNGTPFLHVEAKRTERFRPYDAMAQAQASLSKSGSEDIPVIITRRNRVPTGESLVLLHLDDFLFLYSLLLQTTGHVPSDQS